MAIQLADRLSKLGTETAFAVSGEAAAHVAVGNKVYPFHLGDMNITTPRNIIEATYEAMKAGKTGYCPNYGIPALREVLAEDINKSHGTGYTMANVAIQPGGKPSIGKFVLALMNPGDEALYPNPGYPIYESQIQFNGGVAVPYTYHEGEENFELDIDAIEALITPKTKLLIVNDLQNPTGAESSPEQLEAIAKLAVKHDLFVLSDEAYFDMRYAGKSTSLASFEGMQERSVILYTFSKKYAMTGWRLGASIGPKEVIDMIAKLNVNDESCSNHFIQYGGIEALTGDQSGHEEILSLLKERRDMTVDILNSIPGVKCYRPDATFYLFPNVTELMQAKGLTDYEQFRKAVLQDTGVSFCTRKHFGSPIAGEKEFYIRFAYSGIDLDQIEEGLGKFKAWAE
ncbi:MAG TPA: aminotransferase class I/II-fold pyridoxal phosphate-dependent enzyme [Opitutales bacterium]|nr:aminotransferase class I/II-fold pyridoxal phosphate-dependent enzyme [Opitutales bacterium]